MRRSLKWKNPLFLGCCCHGCRFAKARVHSVRRNELAGESARSLFTSISAPEGGISQHTLLVTGGAFSEYGVFASIAEIARAPFDMHCQAIFPDWRRSISVSSS
jgi:7-keto-8-aminopelargonate synthetase-like enzyme